MSKPTAHPVAPSAPVLVSQTITVPLQGMSQPLGELGLHNTIHLRLRCELRIHLLPEEIAPALIVKAEPTDPLPRGDMSLHLDRPTSACSRGPPYGSPPLEDESLDADSIDMLWIDHGGESG
jgi:hypothetical protein